MFHHRSDQGRVSTVRVRLAKRRRSYGGSDYVPPSTLAGAYTSIVQTRKAVKRRRISGTTMKDRIFSLPPELRHRIYGYILSSISLEPWQSHRKFYNKRADPDHSLRDYKSLTQLCRQSYFDTVGDALLYKIACFHFDDPKAMYDYLGVVHRDHKDAIRCVHLRLGLDRWQDGSCHLLEIHALELLRYFKSLRKLILTISLQGVTYEWQPCPHCGQLHLGPVTSFCDEALANIKSAARASEVIGLNSFKLCLDIRYQYNDGSKHILPVWSSRGTCSQDQRYHNLEEELKCIFMKKECF